MTCNDGLLHLMPPEKLMQATVETVTCLDHALDCATSSNPKRATAFSMWPSKRLFVQLGFGFGPPSAAAARSCCRRS